MGKVVVAGGTGFVGRPLVSLLELHGHEVIVLTRGSSAPGSATAVQWDAKSVGEWASSLEGATAVVNLVGESVAQRWTPDVQKRILESRVDATTAIGRAIESRSQPPEAWINASAIGWYGDTGSREVSEAAPNGDDWLAEVCLAWERAVDAIETPSTRKVKLRVGVVLGKDGGAFPTLAGLTKAFLGGSVGSGDQYMSWIHLTDVVRMFDWAIANPISGILNGTSPNPVTNAELMAEMRRCYGRPPVPPAPNFALRLAERFGAPPAETVLASTRAVPTIPLARGFRFDYPELRMALRELTDDLPPAWKQAKAGV